MLSHQTYWCLGGNSSKLTDVGRAAYKGHAPPHDSLTCAGDPVYAPLELLFGDAASEWEVRRLGCDLYLLGSMIGFFFLGASTTPAILAKMLPSHHPKIWSGTYGQVLPFARAAFDEVVEDLRKTVDPAIRDGLCEIFRQLCDPDPKLRGHPRDRAGFGSPYSLERYISRFNTLATTAEINMKRK